MYWLQIQYRFHCKNNIVFLDPHPQLKYELVEWKFLSRVVMVLLCTNLLIGCQYHIWFTVGRLKWNAANIHHLLSKCKCNCLWWLSIIFCRPLLALLHVPVIIPKWTDAMGWVSWTSTMDYNAYTRDIPSSMPYSVSFHIKAYSRNNDQIQSLFI